MKILVPIDFSPASFKAFEFAKSFLQLVNAVDENTGFSIHGGDLVWQIYDHSKRPVLTYKLNFEEDDEK